MVKESKKSEVREPVVRIFCGNEIHKKQTKNSIFLFNVVSKPLTMIKLKIYL